MNVGPVFSVVGARPQFVKAAVVERELRALGIEVVGIHTGQHYDYQMSQVFFDELGLEPPVSNLAVGSGTHAEQTAAVLTGLEPLLMKASPPCVVVYGDTNSTLGATLAASKLRLRIAHVEAGLRSFDRHVPEEQNRIVTDHLSDILFAPSAVAVDNLTREGLAERTALVGDVMLDVHRLVQGLVDPEAAAKAYGVEVKGFVLATIHRARNTDDATRLHTLLEAIGRSRLPVLLPLHPRTVARLDGYRVPDHIKVVAPLGFRDMVALELASDRVVTDSGGVQKEALWAGVPCVTIRDETEWVETVEAGWNTLTGADPERIAVAIDAPPPGGTPPSFYGDGAAGKHIAEYIARDIGA